MIAQVQVIGFGFGFECVLGQDWVSDYAPEENLATCVNPWLNLACYSNKS